MNAFEVERILDRRTRRKGRRKILEYRIRWQNFGPSEDTWEPRENLRGCPELLREFEDNLAQMQEADHMDVSSTTDNFGGSDSEEERGYSSDDDDSTELMPASPNMPLGPAQHKKHRRPAGLPLPWSATRWTVVEGSGSVRVRGQNAHVHATDLRKNTRSTTLLPLPQPALVAELMQSKTVAVAC
ncbi:uncharacterized protein LOC144113569 isoform X1 [Amblyomma americanum]